MQKRDAINDMTPVAIPLSVGKHVDAHELQKVIIQNNSAATITATNAGCSEMTITAQDNSWHERGEFPAAGCGCEVNHENGSGWIRAKVIYITSEYAILLNEGSAGEYPARLSKTKFRPLDYEKTLFVSGIVEMASGGLISTESAREFAVKLFDSGYRKAAK